ncbi:MAG: metallophosphoesterase family protein [Candidatus Dormibacteria bacterium]
MRIAVIADTHLPRRARDLPPSAWQTVRSADAVIHAGDVVADSLLDRLEAERPLHAVRGNNDTGLLRLLPERLDLRLEGVEVGVVHDAGPTAGRRGRLRALFPRARVVVYGHSHIPVVDDEGGLLLLNPGSPTDRRRMPFFTMAVLDITGSSVTARLVDLGLERA